VFFAQVAKHSFSKKFFAASLTDQLCGGEAEKTSDGVAFSAALPDVAA
jgi:hypothetical protein